MTRYEIALKRSEQFDLITDYCLQLIQVFCRQHGLKVLYTGEADVIKMGRAGIFALTSSQAGATKHLEVSFFYQNGEQGEILWEPQSPVVKVY